MVMIIEPAARPAAGFVSPQEQEILQFYRFIVSGTRKKSVYYN